MKIGFVLDDSLDSTDGVQQYILTLGEWFGSQGHEVHYLVGKTTRSDLSHVHSLAKNMKVRFNGNTMSMPLPISRRKVRRLLSQERFDVLHVQMPYSPFMAAKIIKLAPRQTAVVGTFHILPFATMQKIGAKMLHIWLRSSLKRFDRVWSVSEPARAFARSLGVSSDVLPNAIGVSQFKGAHKLTQYDAYEKKIVFLGRLVERKGCMELLHALKLLHAQNGLDGVKVLIGGKGQQKEHLERWVQHHGLEETVAFLGFVSEEQKPDFLATADIAVFPSISGESFGIVLLEAIASGAGVTLGGNNPGYESVLGSTSKALFDPQDTEAFAALLKELLTDPIAVEELHEAQTASIAQYDVSVVGAKLLVAYQEIIAKRNA